MRFQTTLLYLLFLCTFSGGYAQVLLTEGAPVYNVNFGTPMQSTVGYNTYNGGGFSPTLISGRLNSAAWETTGWENGDLYFNGAMSNPAHGRGSVSGGVVTEGLYAYTDNPASVANPTLLIQAGDNDFANGTLALKIKNNGTTNMTQIQVSYNLFVRNDKDRSHHFNFSHSADNVVYEPEPSLDYTTPDTADAFQWTQVGVSPSRSIFITGLNIAPGGVYYIRWSCSDPGGTGDWDEIGLDDITITGTYGPPAAEINVIGSSSLTIIHNDMTPIVADGTQFPTTYIGGSMAIMTYLIQNVGGAPLNISSITLTGPNASDFSIVGTAATGTIPGITSVISFKELTTKFMPVTAGVKVAYINIFSNDANENPYIFKIQGTGATPQPDISIVGNTPGFTSPIFSTTLIPSTFNGTLFPDQNVGGAGVVRDYKIRNDGVASTLVLTAPSPYIQIGGSHPADFILETFPSSNTMNNGHTRFFSIRFKPTGSGIRSALITIPNNDTVLDVFGKPEGPYTFLVQGNGVAPEADISGNAQPIVSGSMTPTLVNHTFFDYLNITSGTLDRTYTITNSGSTPLTLGTVSVTGSSAFTIQAAPSTTVAVGASTTLVIRFNPSTAGMTEAIVSMATNDIDENPYQFKIRGYGVDYIPCTFAAVETIAIQNFEVVPATPNWAFTQTGTAASVAGGTSWGIVGDGGLSTRFLGAKSWQVASNTNTTATITLAAVNTSLYDDVELNIKLSAMAATSAQGLDAADKVIVSISADNGATWSNELQVSGSTDAKWTFASGTGIAATTYDGNNVITPYTPATAGFLTSNGYGTLSVSGLPKVSNLQVRLTVTNNADEVWAIDNVGLFGRKEISTTWTGSAWTNGAPTASVKAIINGNYNTSSGNIAACKCQIMPGKAVTINSNQYFNIESNLINDGFIIIENGGSLVQHNDFATNTAVPGSITIRRYTTPMRQYDFTYWSSPVVSQTLYNLSPATLSDKYFTFNPLVNNWQTVPSGTIMEPGKGYIIRAPEGFTSTPSPYTNGQFIGAVNNGIINPPVVVGASSWNLLGNPYPSAIDADLFLAYPTNTGVIGGTIYFWTHNTAPVANNYSSNDYAVYNLLGGVGTAAGNSGANNTVPTGTIASGQGFFISATANGAATFANSMRITGSNMEFFRAGGLQHNTPTTIEKHRIWLNLSNELGAFKQALVGYTTNATNGNDREYDGTVLAGGNSVSLYSLLDSQPLAIQGRALPFDTNDIIPLGYTSAQAATYQISIDNLDGLFVEQDVYLKDNDLNIIHDLKLMPYSFSTAAGTFNERFELRFATEALGVDEVPDAVSGVTVAVKKNVLQIVSVGHNITEVIVYDLLGRKVFAADQVDNTTFSAEDIVTNKQALIVRVKLENGHIVSRKILY